MADDHAPLRARIREALEAGGCVVCGEGATAQEAISLTRAHDPDVVLLDIMMPGNGIRAAQQISREHPQTAIVMLTISQDDNDLFDALRAGASGYLLKDTDPGELPGKLRDVLAGEAAIPPRLVARILDEFRGYPRRSILRRSAAARRLSPRERDVMELLGQGNSTREVGSRLFISPTTVRVHVSAVLRKLAVQDRKSAFTLLMEAPPPPRLGH